MIKPISPTELPVRREQHRWAAWAASTTRLCSVPQKQRCSEFT